MKLNSLQILSLLVMVETDYFILTQEQFEENLPDAQELGVSLDYYLMEFTHTEGSMVEYVDGEWIEIKQ